MAQSGDVAISAPKIEGGIFFFTVVLAERSSELFVKHIERLRQGEERCATGDWGGDVAEIKGRFRE